MQDLMHACAPSAGLGGVHDALRLVLRPLSRLPGACAPPRLLMISADACANTQCTVHAVLWLDRT